MRRRAPYRERAATRSYNGPVRRVLLLIPSATYRADAFLAAAERLGAEIVVGSNRAPALASARMLHVDYEDPEAGPQQIAAFAHDHPLDAILAIDDQGVALASRAARWLELPHNPIDAVLATRNKLSLRRRLAEAGLASPKHLAAVIRDDPTVLAERAPYPCVLKPLALSGSRGVIRADNPPTFVAAFQRLRALLSNPEIAAECGDAAAGVLIEEFIPGTEVALEGLLEHGDLQLLALFDKPDPLDGPYFEETIYVTPSRLPQKEQETIAATAARAAHALGLHSGPVHIELRINEDGIWPIDLAARTIGGHCARAFTFAGGVSLEELVLRQALDEAPNVERDSLASGVMMIPVPGEGILQAVHGVDKARAVPLITEVLITVTAGRRLVPLPEGGEYPGFIFARGEAPGAVEAALRRAHAALTFELDTSSADSPSSPAERSRPSSP